MPDIAACDFFTVPTVTFRVLYVFIVLCHDRRHVVHFNITTNPYAEWAAQQIVDAFPYEDAPRFLIRDRDGIYGDYFKKRVKDTGIEEVLIPPRSPWQNPYCERVIGSIRRECLNHTIVLNERHLHRILSEYLDYYHHGRCHLSLDRNAPVPRRVEPPSEGEVVSIPQVGGLHQRYTRRAAGRPIPCDLRAPRSSSRAASSRVIGCNTPSQRLALAGAPVLGWPLYLG